MLNAAEVAADQIRETAAEEAARMLEDARTTKLEAERAREQVEQDRATTYKAAEAVAAQIRLAAEQEAEDIVNQAHLDAKVAGEESERRRHVARGRVPWRRGPPAGDPGDDPAARHDARGPAADAGARVGHSNRVVTARRAGRRWPRAVRARDP